MLKSQEPHRVGIVEEVIEVVKIETSPNRPAPVAKVEPTEEEVQKQIRETLRKTCKENLQ